MATLFKKTNLRDIPNGANLTSRRGRNVATWTDGRGTKQKAEVILSDDGRRHVRMESNIWTAQFRLADGREVRRSTGCRDKSAAESVLSDWLQQEEKLRAGIFTESQLKTSEHLNADIQLHVKDYLANLDGRNPSVDHRKNVVRHLNAGIDECGFHTLADVNATVFTKWLNSRSAINSARTRNIYRASWVAFCNWCCNPAERRLPENPLYSVPVAPETDDTKRQRRALTVSALSALLDAARRRPLVEAMTIRRGQRKGQLVANVKPENRQRLERLGRERELIYRSLALTGLRRGELASLTIGQAHLDVAVPYVELGASHEKNRAGTDIPLRRDLADMWREWISTRISEGAGPTDPIFRVPGKLIHVFDRDLAFAGIPKTDDDGRTVDVHAMRKTFGTLLSKAGALPKEAQLAMRHSRMELTMQIYTDPKLFDVAGVVEKLPSLDGQSDDEKQSLKFDIA